MASRKTLAHRFFDITKISSQTLSKSHISPNPNQTTLLRKFLAPPDSEQNGFFRRILQKRAIFQSAISPEFKSLPIGDKLIEKLRGLNRDRLQLQGLAPLPAETPKSDSLERVSVDEVRKLLRVSQLERLKLTLRGIQKNCISYTEYVEICKGCIGGSNLDDAFGVAKMLDESGVVIVLGNSVFLHPDQVAKAIESVIPLHISQPNDPRRKELEKMEKAKSEIDEKAEALVKRELWLGLCFLVAQTAGFMRLTFWELSWDVMEPICFYVTSIYFMAGYAFFLRTSRDPSFEGFFDSRFNAKQKRLMKINKFDIHRFNELRRACYPSSSQPSSSSCVTSQSTLVGAALHHF